MKAILNNAKLNAIKTLNEWNEANGYKGLTHLEDTKTDQFFNMIQYKSHLENEIEALKSKGARTEKIEDYKALVESCHLVIEDSNKDDKGVFLFVPDGGCVHVKADCLEDAENKLDRCMTEASKAFDAYGILYESYGFCQIVD